MIQRIQSVYLLLTIVIGVIMMFVPMIDFVSGSMSFNFGILGIIDPNGSEISVSLPSLPLLGLVVFSMIISVSAILLFKNRSLQIKLCRLNMFLLSVFLILVVFISEKLESQLGASNQNISFEYGMIFPFLSIILLTLAVRSIKQDEALIRSVDRIR